MKTYLGKAPHGVVVRTADGKTRALGLFLHVRNHSPTGFSWGYGGSGPAQLALALCMESVGRRRALYVYQDFKFAVIAKLLPGQDWELTEQQVRMAIESIETSYRYVAP